MNNKPPPPLHVKTGGFGTTTVSPTSPSLCFPASSTSSVAIKENPHLHHQKQSSSSSSSAATATRKKQQQNGLCGCCHRSQRSHCVSAIGMYIDMLVGGGLQIVWVYFTAATVHLNSIWGTKVDVKEGHGMQCE